MSPIYTVLCLAQYHESDFILMGEQFSEGQGGGMWVTRSERALPTVDALPADLKKPHWLFLVDVKSPSTRRTVNRRLNPALCPIWEEKHLMSTIDAGPLPPTLAALTAYGPVNRWSFAWRAWQSAMVWVRKRHGEAPPARPPETVYDHLLKDE